MVSLILQLPYIFDRAALSHAAFKACFKSQNNSEKLYKEIICDTGYFLVWCRTPFKFI